MENFSWSNIKNDPVYLNKKINYATIKSEFLAKLKSENGGANYDFNSPNILTENKDKFLAFVRTNYGDKYADMFQDGFNPENVEFQDGEILSISEEQDNSVVLSDLLNSAEDAEFFDGFFEDDKMQDFLNKFDSDSNGVIDFGEAISAFEAIEKAKSEKNNKPQNIVLEEESLDVSKETENILEVKDKLVAKDDVSKNTAIEAIGENESKTANINALVDNKRVQQQQNAKVANDVQEVENNNNNANKNNNVANAVNGGNVGGGGNAGGVGGLGAGTAQKANNKTAQDKATTTQTQDVTKLSNDALSQYKTAQSAEVSNAEKNYNSAANDNTTAKSNLTTVQFQMSQNVAEKQGALDEAKAHYDEVASKDSYLQSPEGRELNAKREANLQAISDCEKTQTETFDAKNDAILAKDNAKPKLTL